MMRKLFATCIAIIVSIPLIPVVEKTVGYLTGTGQPMVFPAQGWHLEMKDDGLRNHVANGSRGEAIVAIDASGSMESRRAGILDGSNPAIVYWGRLRNAYQGGDLRLWLFASSSGWEQASSEIGRAFMPGFDRYGPEDWAIHDTQFYTWATTDPDVGSTAQATPNVPRIRAIEPSSVAGSAFTISITGAGFAAGSVVTLTASPAAGSTFQSFSGSPLGHVAFVAQVPEWQSALPPLFRTPLPNPEVWTSAAGSYAQLTKEWPKDSSQLDAATLDRLIKINARLAEALKSASETQQVATNTVLVQERQHVDRGGWYALDVGERVAEQRAIEIDFVPDGEGERKSFRLKDAETGGGQAGWIHIKEPGSLIIRASGVKPTLRDLGSSEFISRLADITVSKALLTVFLLEEVLPLGTWIFIVWKIRGYAYKRITQLPRTVRKHARGEVDLMLGFAKWSGVGCYVLWTAKDILAGAGIVLVT